MAVKRKELPMNGEEPPQKYRRGLELEGEDGYGNSDPFENDALHEKPFTGAVADRRTVRLFTCGFAGCDYTVDRQAKMDNHRRTHTGEKPFACTVEGCDKSYARKDKLKHHQQYGHGEAAPRPHACEWPGCKKTYITKQHLEKHIELHEKKFYCTEYGDCDAVFRKQKTLDEHIARQHLQARPYPCTYVDPKTGERCTKGYDVEQALNVHINTAHVEQARYFNCLVCPAPGSEFEAIETANGTIFRAKEGLRFETYADFNAHNRQVHPPKCPQCGKISKNPSALQAHIDTVHANPERIPCPRPGCNTVFKATRTLNAHILHVHDKPKSFVCVATAFAESKKPELKAWDGKDACGAAYSSKNNLEQHIRREHLHAKNRKETRKERKARTKAPPRAEPSTLQLLTGHGYDDPEDKKKIVCTERNCEHRFSREYDLRRHLWGVHNLDEFTIEERILERNALEGGEFWYRGEDLGFQDEDGSFPQSPNPDYHYSPTTPLDEMEYEPSDLGDGPFQTGLFDAMKRAVEDDAEEAEMDQMMGLETLQNWNMQNGMPRN